MPVLSEEEFRRRLTMAMDKHEALRGLGVGYRAALDDQVLNVVEVLANPTTRQVALLVPNGRQDDPSPWLVITPSLCDGADGGVSWESDRYVYGWLVVQHGGAS